MVLVLGLIVSLVPIMRLKDYLFKNGIELQEFYLKVKSLDLVIYLGVRCGLT